MKRGQTIGLSLLGAAAVLGAAGWYLGETMYHKVLDTALPGKWPRTENPLSHSESVFCRSEDGLQLHAWTRRAGEAGHRWAICVHGYRGTPADLEQLAAIYCSQGFHVLLPALRGHGESEGDYAGMGWHDRLDLLCWIRWVLERDAQAEIILHGFSMGAAAVMLAAGESLPLNVRCVVEDCGYTTAEEEFSFVCRKKASPALLAALPFLKLVMRGKAHYRFRDASPLAAVSRAAVPILFIHGAEDDFVPTDMVYRLYDAAGGPRMLYVQPGAGHAKSAETDPAAYQAQLELFVKRYWNWRGGRTAPAQEKSNEDTEEKICP